MPHLTLQTRAFAMMLAIGVSMSCTPDAGKPPTEISYTEILEQGRPNPDAWPAYKPLSLAERNALDTALTSFYAQLSTHKPFSEKTKNSLLKGGLRLKELTHQGDMFVALYEAGPAWRGHGGYLFRRGHVGIDEVLIQAPHSFHDHMTGELAREVFEGSRARGFFFNTIHRYRSRKGERTRDARHPADMARSDDSVYHLLSTKYLEDIESSWVLQLHGFKSKKLRRAGIHAVVASGQPDEPAARAQAIQKRLAKAFGSRSIALYPRDTMSFGALSNVLGAWCQTKAPGRFVHIEFNLELRESLLQDPSKIIELTAL